MTAVSHHVPPHPTSTATLDTQPRHLYSFTLTDDAPRTGLGLMAARIPIVGEEGWTHEHGGPVEILAVITEPDGMAWVKSRGFQPQTCAFARLRPPEPTVTHTLYAWLDISGQLITAERLPHHNNGHIQHRVERLSDGTWRVNLIEGDT